ncbi:MAG: hypothetical protein ACYTKD_27970, partial [Planctomycetota bacterium]
MPSGRTSLLRAAFAALLACAACASARAGEPATEGPSIQEMLSAIGAPAWDGAPAIPAASAPAARVQVNPLEMVLADIDRLLGKGDYGA